MATIAFLGHKLDLMIRGIGEELKGWTHLDKPYVAKKMILQAVWRQNELILALQAKILEMAEIEAGLQLTMNDLQKEVIAFRNTAEKVDNMDAMLKVKIPIFNQLNGMVDVHGEAITRVITKLVRQSLSLLSFKVETRSAVSESKWGLGDLIKTVNALTSTIRIFSRQVRHSTDNLDRGGSYDVKGEGEEVLVNIISQQEQRAFLQEDQVQIHLRKEVRNAPRVEGIAVES